jgi:hypothetical protein
LIVLYARIVKLRIQPEKPTQRWTLTIREEQRAIRRLLTSLPSLRSRADEILREVDPDAVAAAFDEMGARTGSDLKACLCLISTWRDCWASKSQTAMRSAIMRREKFNALPGGRTGYVTVGNRVLESQGYRESHARH